MGYFLKTVTISIKTSISSNNKVSYVTLYYESNNAKKKRDYTITFNFHEDEHLWWLIIY